MNLRFGPDGGFVSILLAIVYLLIPTAAAPADVLQRRAEYVMGTILTATVGAPDSSTSARALDSVFATVRRLDHLLSNYDPSSEIGRINASAPRAVSVSDVTFEFVTRTVKFAAQCGGALDPTVGPLVAAWGFFAEEKSTPPDSAELSKIVPLVNYHRVRIDSAAMTIALDSGMQFDPGATGKGFALEQALSLLADMTLTSVTLDFGGQVCRRGPDTVGVAIQHPRSGDSAITILNIASGSVATSGDYERFFIRDGERYAHIIDPRHGSPVRGRAAVSVYAPDPWTADALSTALFVLGPEAGLKLAREFSGVGVLFVEWNGDSLVYIPDSMWLELERR